MSVFVWGLLPHIKTDKGVLKQPTPIKVKFPKSQKPIKVQSSTHSFYVLTEEGKVFSFGSGKGGRLGHGSTDDVVNPKLISSIKDKKMVDIFAQNWNAGAIDENGVPYIWGKIVDSNVPKPFENLKEKIKKISFGGDFLLLLTEGGELYAFGKNSKYQCGTKEPSQFNTPTKISIKDNLKFSYISCGYHNAIAITEDKKEVYVWGSNNCGQLMVKKITKPKLPRKISFGDLNVGNFEHCAFSLSDKYVHAGVVDDDGNAYFWGSNYKAKLANGNTEDELSKPLQVKCFKNNEKIKEIIPGGIHNFILDTEQNLYSFGCGSDGRLGHPESVNYTYLYKEKYPRLIEALKGGVLSAHSSYYAGIALCKKAKKLKTPKKKA